MTADVITLPKSLDALADRIRGAYERTERRRPEWIEGTLELAAALADADRDGHAAWQEYVAGTCPTNADSRFLVGLSMSGGTPFLSWTPNLGTARRSIVEGKAALTEGDWVSPTNSASRFFRVKVEIP